MTASGPDEVTAIVRDITERAQAEEDLSKSELKYQALISEMFTGFALNQILYDTHGKPVDYITLEVNKAFESYLNTTREAVIGKKASDILPPEELKYWLDILGLIVQTGEPAHYEMYSPVNQKYFEGSAFYSGKDQFAVTFTDVTAQKQAEMSLRKSQAELLELIEHTPDIIARFDRNYRHVFVNQAVTKETGRPVIFYIGKSHRELGDMPLEQIEFSENIIRQVFESGQEVSFEISIPKEQGMKSYLSRGVPEFGSDGRVATALFIHRNITDRKHAEEELGLKTQEVDEFFRSALDLMCIADTNGYFLRLNQEWSNVLGYPLSELEGHRFLDFVHPDDLAVTVAAVSDLRAQKTVSTFTNRYRCQDGSYRWIEWRSTPQGDRIYAAARDITGRKQTEQALRENQVILKQILDTLPQAVFWKDKKGVYLGCNQTFVRACGLSDSGEVVGKTDFDLPWSKAETEAYRADDAQVISTRIPKLNIIEPLHQADGTRLWVSTSKMPLLDAQQEVRGVLGIYDDITERISAEQALMNANEALIGHFNMGMVGMCVTSPEKGWIEVNEHLCRMLGYTKEELIHLTWADLTHPDDLDADIALFKQVLAGARDSYELDKRYIRKDGQVVYTTLYVTCQRKQDGTVRYFLASLVDITARKQMEESLKQSIKEKEVLMQELQHRIKNSLMVASSLLALEEGNLPDERTRAIFASTQARLNSMAGIYEQLYRGGGIDRVALHQYIQRLVSELSHSYIAEEQSLRIETHLHEVQIDLKRALPLGIILNELVTNAIKYAFPVGISWPEQPGVISVALIKTGKEVQLLVSDQGVGAPDAVPHGGGTGLELVRMLARQINGKFDIDFTGGCTARVTFQLE